MFSRASGSGDDLYLLELAEGLQPKGEPRLLPSESTSSSEPAWTPDGHEILFLSGSPPGARLYQMPLSQPGWRPSRPIWRAFAGLGVRMPAISRQGRLAYAIQDCGANIWRLELNGEHHAIAPPTSLVPSTKTDHVPAYSPDGKRIAFASDRTGSHEIWVCNSDGSSAMPLTSLGGSAHTADPQWSPDGRLILFHSNVGGRAATYLINANGGKSTPLCTGCFADSFSHDGKWTYFTDQGQVWKMPWPFPGSAREGVQITRHGGWGGHESPDGKMLYYGKGDDQECGSLWRVPVEGGEETQVLDSFCSMNFAVVDHGIYFIPAWRPGDKPLIQYLDFATGKTETIASLTNDAAYGISVSPDRRSLLYTQYRFGGSDLLMVENFR